MVVLNRIYTRTGDKGDTALSDGQRVPKHAPRVEAYGTVDELNATLGLARLHASDQIAARIAVIQNDLFDLGADLSRPHMDRDDQAPYPVLRIIESQVARLETEIDAMNADLAPLRSFILPGGSPAGAQLHVARTIARRAERAAWRCAEEHGFDAVGGVNPLAITYLNRLSDLLFIMSRAANGTDNEVLWVPGTDREKPSRH